jgi:uncharacterized protein
VKAAYKKKRLIENLGTLDSLLVAFSGGVDSTFLLAVAHEILKDRVVAVTADSAIHPARDRQTALKLAQQLSVRHRIIFSRELDHTDFIRNEPDRCYVCKKYLFADLLKVAGELEITHIAHGANRDDLKDYRPGFKAATEMGILAPLVDAELTKEDIRILSKEMKLDTWNKPAMACLASRIPYGTELSLEKLKMVADAETVLLNEGFSACRVRYHGSVARIEIPVEDIQNLLDKGVRERVITKIRTIGFSHVSIDLEGYVQGSMNRGVTRSN